MHGEKSHPILSELLPLSVHVLSITGASFTAAALSIAPSTISSLTATSIRWSSSSTGSGCWSIMGTLCFLDHWLIYDHQHHMGLLIMERRELASKYEQVKTLAESSELMHKHDSAMTKSALTEARQREETKEQWDAYKSVIDSCSKLRSEKWIEQASEPNKEAVIKALLGAKEAMLGIRYHMRLMGEAAGVPIEPEPQTKLLDATLNLEGVLLAGVPGAGGFDAVFAVTFGDSSSNVMKTWSSLNVLALLVKEDPCGVSLESVDPRTNEITSAVSSIHIE
ncbi:hypothetical protein S83_066072 [Arachis hypogaea]